ncbi:MAG: VCBS repeat-containing protein, partial [Pyrinomonadaceae bacterium]|nr:VCBS repeat-containing protein [Pyrinomonadaceae bacterium]
MIKLKILITIGVLAASAFAQTRSFRDRPDILLGLKSDRTASLSFADVDGDKDLDAIVANGRHWPQINEVFLNNGKGRFTVGYTLGSLFATSYAVPAADLDGDGDKDIVVGNDRAANMIYLNNGKGKYSLVGSLGPEVEPTRDVILADLNGDR